MPSFAKLEDVKARLRETEQERDQLKLHLDITRTERDGFLDRLQDAGGMAEEKRLRNERVERLTKAPMTAARVVKALTKRPELLWDVATALNQVDVVGPWTPSPLAAFTARFVRKNPLGNVVASVLRGLTWDHYKGYALEDTVQGQSEESLAWLLHDLDRHLISGGFMVIGKPHVAGPWTTIEGRDNGSFEQRLVDAHSGVWGNQLAVICRRDTLTGWYECMGDTHIVYSKEEARKRCDGILTEHGWMLTPKLDP